jgi:hypothetical protein
LITCQIITLSLAKNQGGHLEYRGGRVLATEKDDNIVFTSYITLANGRRIYAASYGLKVFAIRVKTRK